MTLRLYLNVTAYQADGRKNEKENDRRAEPNAGRRSAAQLPFSSRSSRSTFVIRHHRTMGRFNGIVRVHLSHLPYKPRRYQSVCNVAASFVTMISNNGRRRSLIVLSVGYGTDDS